MWVLLLPSVALPFSVMQVRESAKGGQHRPCAGLPNFGVVANLPYGPFVTLLGWQQGKCTLILPGLDFTATSVKLRLLVHSQPECLWINVRSPIGTDAPAFEHEGQCWLRYGEDACLCQFTNPHESKSFATYSSKRTLVLWLMLPVGFC